jgi:SulP family sulfate permease
VESLLCGAVASNMTGIGLHANQELVAQGVGNMLIPFFGVVPATAAIARTSVGIKSGGQTRLVSIVHALALLASCSFWRRSCRASRWRRWPGSDGDRLAE